MKVSIDKIRELQKNTKKIRNVCILAHVDHGKTTLADALISSNGLISQKLAGKLRYMDSREDEQTRGITMKSSAISLHYISDAKEEYLINLIDSPGHVDFSGEVSSVVRLCDGALVVVDVMEGVCAQTKSVLRQAWSEGLSVVLVLNKVDRLVVEVKMNTSEAELRLMHIVEQVNAFTAELLTSQVHAKSYKIRRESTNKNKDYFHLDDWGSGMEDIDDSRFYFSPDRDNVVFASAYDGWAFRLSTFSNLYAQKLQVVESELLAGLWGDYYIDAKKKMIKSGAKSKGKKSVFQQLVLENIWRVYEALINKDKDLIEKIICKLGINVRLRPSSDLKSQLQSILGQWLPLTTTVLDMVATFIPSPQDLPEDRIERFIGGPMTTTDNVSSEANSIIKAFQSCSSSLNDPVIIFISKMVPFLPQDLPQNKHRPLTMQEIAVRRELMRQNMLSQASPVVYSTLNNEDNNVKNNGNINIENLNSDKTVNVSNREVVDRCNISDVLNENTANNINNKKTTMHKNSALFDTATTKLNDTSTNSAKNHTITSSNDKQLNNTTKTITASDNNSETTIGEKHTFIGFGRIFSGVISKASCVYVLSPKHQASNAHHILQQLKSGCDETSLLNEHHIQKFRVTDLYVMMGRELEEVEEVPAGNILGIGGLEKIVLRTASLSTSLHAPTYSDLVRQTCSIVKVAVEPLKSTDMAVFIEGLRLLKQSDPCLEVEVEENGEHVLIASGEVHLNKCLDDFKKRFGKIEVIVSPPTVAFKETIVVPPLVDRVNELMVGERRKDASRSVEMVTAEGWFLRVRAAPLLDEVVKVLEKHSTLLKEFSRTKSNFTKNVKNPKLLEELKLVKEELEVVFESLKGCKGWVDKLWAIDLTQECSNVLLNGVETYRRPSFFDICMDQSLESSLLANDQGVINGFEMAVKAGSICEESVYGVAFVIEAWHKLENPEEYVQKLNSVGGQEDGNKGIGDKYAEKSMGNIEIDKNERGRERTGRLGGNKDDNREGERSVKWNLLVNKEADKEINKVVFYRGILMGGVRNCCRSSMELQPQRIMWAMYSCTIHATKKILGKMYAVLSKRHGRVLSEEMLEGSSLFEIVSVLPIIESFGFAEEFRKKTSGMAIPQFKFSHWEAIDIDPYWVPTTNEEYLHFGEKADSDNVARMHMNAIRKRKGLSVREKLVEFGDKQRTLSKNK